ncbi:hypothetical protein GSI_10035 [Ganoderma sinense ZZ0214-1]|uniref:Retrotransposon gag domain-containing protein n=1 Tax=Ganoderma sinense ZZ0214-1 TaxID=1077348 RepID=A0A2G8RZI5_9APHY|nr:hypothetical protein GSI_10035 [Ganoderma sinense ZZ0214-1]
MSTTSNAAKGKGTSNEAATTPSLPDITLGERLELEASGELLDPHSLPLADPEPVPSRGGRPPSRPDATEVALGVKWGLADYGRVMEGQSGRRVTRNTAQTVRSGESASAAPAGTYRGHRGTRLLQNVLLEPGAARPEASQQERGPETVSRLPVETRLEGAGDREDVRRDGSLLEDTDECRDGHLLEIERRDGRHLTQSDERREGSLPDESDQRREGSSGDRISPDLPGLEIGEWRGTDGTVADFAKRQQADTGHLDVNAIVVEVPETAESPKGHDGRYTTGQKQKHVPRATPQREFLQTFVGGDPTVRATSEPRQPPMTSTPRRHQTPASYKGDASQVPDSRWNPIAAGGGRGGGREGGNTPPDSSDPSSSSESSSSDDDGRGPSPEPDDPESDVPATPPRSKSPSKKRHRKKQREDTRETHKLLKRINLKPPAKWDGTPDLDKFDHWKYELNTWAELNKAPGYLIVKTMTNYVSGKASRFFMDHVANSNSEWSLENVYDGLFDYCFPDDFKAMLRRRLMTAKQGSLRVRDYVREIEHLASRFRDITEFQLVQIFWQGLNGYLQVELIDKGLGPETTALERLVKYAVRKEKANIEARKLQREFVTNVDLLTNNDLLTYNVQPN